LNTASQCIGFGITSSQDTAICVGFGMQVAKTDLSCADFHFLLHYVSTIHQHYNLQTDVVLVLHGSNKVYIDMF